MATWLDRAIGYLSPQTGLKRIRARVAGELLQRHYEGAATGRRTQGWNRAAGDVNAVMGASLARLREVARDLVRNNPHAESALDTIANHTVGWGIVAKPEKPNTKLQDLWNEWAGTTACDSDGRNDFYGLQHLVIRTVVESGEVLVRRRRRFLEDGLPLPLQLQVLDPDFIDTMKTGIVLRSATGVEYGRIIHGIEFDLLGRRVAYWLFPEHPGAQLFGTGAAFGASRRIPAENILHIYKDVRPGQVRGASWFAPVILRFKDFDEFEDATLMKQKIAACLAVLTSDVDGMAPALGVEESGNPAIDSLEPGMILNVPPGRSVTTVTPPVTGDYEAYSQTTLRTIATGLGIAYEDLTGDYTNLPFSAARMSRLHHWAKVEKWRWQMLIPQLCNPVWAWAMEAAQILGQATGPVAAEWTPPPAPMIDPANEALAYQRKIRTGLMTQSEAIRECGYDPEDLLAEMAADNAMLDKLGIALDSDARTRTQAGQPTVMVAAVPAPASDGTQPGDTPPADGTTEPPVPPPPGKKKPNGKAVPA